MLGGRLPSYPQNRAKGCSRSLIVGACLDIGACATFWRSPLAGTTTVNFSSAKPACKGPVALLPLPCVSAPQSCCKQRRLGAQASCGLMPSFEAFEQGTNQGPSWQLSLACFVPTATTYPAA